MEKEKGAGSILQFALLQSAVDEGFWHRLSSLKLNKLGIDDSPISISGFYAPCSHAQISNHLTLYSDSFGFGINEESHVPSLCDRNKCRVPGTLYNTNTLESFHAIDKRKLLVVEAKKIWADIQSGKVAEESGVLSRFLLITFADLKKWSFHYWFAFPAIVVDPPSTLIYLNPASKWCTSEEAKSLSFACNTWRSSLGSTADIPFFVVSFNSDSQAIVGELKDWEAFQSLGYKFLFGFYDPCHLPNNPGWPLRNFLTLISSRFAIKRVPFLCYRESRGFADLDLSLIGETLISSSQDWNYPDYEPRAVGWEVKKGKKGPYCINLAKSMDPSRLAESAADLNLKLMRWRALPSLNIDVLSTVKCLLLGAGTLGCQVARMLMAWGVRRITILDSGRVSMSNPLRQSLYTLEDCVDGGDYKATAAVRSLKRIFPAVEAQEVVMEIPMPCHPVESQTAENVMNECRRLHDLVESHDAIFLLTDTRESRWLPTVLCSSANRVAVTAALGFDSFLVMRHGAGPSDSIRGPTDASESSPHQRLGCYFCNDVVAPIDSTSNRTLDQQCTVTRPGLAPIASSLAVELLVGILHHPSGMFADAEFSSDSGTCDRPLGVLPHQIRGSLSQVSQMSLLGLASESCTACSTTVISEYRKRGEEFIMEVINKPAYLEDMTGLTELMRSAFSFELECDLELT